MHLVYIYIYIYVCVCVCVCARVCVCLSNYPTRLHEQDVTQGQFLIFTQSWQENS